MFTESQNTECVGKFYFDDVESSLVMLSNVKNSIEVTFGVLEQQTQTLCTIVNDGQTEVYNTCL